MHLSGHLAVHNLKPGSFTRQHRGEIEIDSIATVLHPTEVLQKMPLRFSLSAFLLCAQYCQIRSHALRHALQHSLWGVKLQPTQPIIQPHFTAQLST